jgi:hypothetical protein
MPKRVSLPSMLPPACKALAVCHAQWRQPRVARCSAAHSPAITATNITVIAATRPALAAVARQRAEGKAQAAGIRKIASICKSSTARRVLIRVRRIRVEEAAAVGAEHLDGHLRGHRAHGQRLRGRGCAAPGVHRERVHVAAKFCTTPWLTRNSANTSDSGSSIHSRDARSGPPRSCRSRRWIEWRQSPRTSANTTAMPVAADRKFCTPSASICVR